MPQILVLFFLTCLFGCASKMGTEDAFSQAEHGFSALTKNSPVRFVKHERYLSAKAVPLEESSAPFLLSSVTLRCKASLQEICHMIMDLVPVNVNVVAENELRRERTNAPSSLAAFLEGETAGDYRDLLSISHEGSLQSLLDQIAAQSGYGYECDASRKTITFARTFVKTFVLTAAPGKVGFKNQLTNKSRNNSTQTSENSDVSAEIAQTYQGSLEFDVFADTVKNVSSMLSPIGSTQANPASGTLTVRDRAENLRQISRFIAEINERYSRQVAMKVNVYSLEVSDEGQGGLDLQAIVPRLALGAGTAALSAGAISLVGSGTAEATILNGHFQGSKAMLKALRAIGNARQLTSAGIVAINNQPAPVEAIKKISYLAETSIETTENGSEVELKPGEVTTGFSMTITPHILDSRKVVLQYNVHLANLDSMETFQSNNATIQLPQISSRAFSQKASLLMGQTLVVAGFQQIGQNEKKSASLLSLGRNQSYQKSLIVITIEVEDARPRLA